MKVIGFYTKEFTAKDGNVVKGLNLIVGNEIKAERGDGLYPDPKPVFIPLSKLERFGYEPFVGQDVTLLWSRDGKLMNIIQN